MSKLSRWFLVITTGLMLHFSLSIYAVARLAPFYNLPTYTVGLPPFGQVNYNTADSIVVIEWVLVFILWLAFAIILLRDKTNENG